MEAGENDAACAAPPGNGAVCVHEKLCVCIQGRTPRVAEVPRSQTAGLRYDSAVAEALPLGSTAAAEAGFSLSGRASVPHSQKAHFGAAAIHQAGAAAKRSAAGVHHGGAQSKHRPAEQEGQPVQAQPKV